MSGLNVMTRSGALDLLLGDEFRCTDAKHNVRRYQFLGVDKSAPSKEIYLLDQTNGSYCNVSRSWFMNRSVIKLSDEQYEPK